MAEQTEVLVVGAGAWGTALAMVLAKNGLQVQLWGRNEERQQQLQSRRENEIYLPGVKFPPSLTAVSRLSDKIDKAVIAVPSCSLRHVLQQLSDRFTATASVCLCCKGVEQESLCMIHEVAAACLPQGARCAIISGPSFAIEVAREEPTGVTVAAAVPEIAEQWTQMFHGNRFRVYAHNDMNGVGIAGAVKNVIAIAAGVADGLRLGANSQAVLITRGLAEMTRVGLALGGRMETFMGLAGVGDLVLTCTSNESRNRRLGRLIAEYGDAAIARNKLAATTEGADAAAPLLALARRVGVAMPISEQVVAILDGKATPEKAMDNLLRRPPRPEYS